MSSADGSDESRGELEVEADRVRSRLVESLAELNRRRHHVVDEVAMLRQEATPIGGVIAAGAIVVGLVLVERRIRAPKVRSYRSRFAAFRRAWNHPDRVAGGGERSAVTEIGIKVLSAVASAIFASLAKRVILSSSLLAASSSKSARAPV